MIEEHPSPLDKLRSIQAHAEQETTDAILSAREGFAFTVPQEVREISDTVNVTAGEGKSEKVPLIDILKTSFEAVQRAWDEAIVPRMQEIRRSSVVDDKAGTDFATAADKASEQTIKQIIQERLDELVKVFGEETKEYEENAQSNISVEIDPIDGTETFKFGTGDGWAILIGVYRDLDDGNREQKASVAYFPEKQKLMYYIKDHGVFISDLHEHVTHKAAAVEVQDDLKNKMMIRMWKHTDKKRRSGVQRIEEDLKSLGAHFRLTNSAAEDALEAIETGGQRILIYDGDMMRVDYIPHAALIALGYKMYI